MNSINLVNTVLFYYPLCLFPEKRTENNRKKERKRKWVAADKLKCYLSAGFGIKFKKQAAE